MGGARVPGVLFRGGPIYPMEGPPLREGGALLTRGRQIAYLGPEGALGRAERAGVEVAQVVELGGRPLLPGLCDGHLHLVLAALQRAAVDLRGAQSVAELQARVRRRVAELPAGTWIVGHGWERRLLFGPDRPEPRPELLDAVTAEHPLFLTSKDLHSAWLNTPALRALGRLPRLPEGCAVQRIGGGGSEPSGLVYEDILALRRVLVPEPSDAQKEAALVPYVRHLWACGITAVHSVETPDELGVVQAMAAGPGPRVRVLSNLVFDTPDALRTGAHLFETAEPGWLACGAAKLFLDGTFGTLTAALSEPYAGGDERGILCMGDEALSAWLEAAAEVGVGAMMHTIGDRAVAQALSALERLGPGAFSPGTWQRLEHAQILSPAILRRPALAKMVFSLQPSHMWDDRGIVERLLPGENSRRWCYPMRTLEQRGTLLLFGSDAPVEDPNPWKGIQAAVTRLEGGGAPPWIAEEQITLERALCAHTVNPARIHGPILGSGVLRPGAPADLTVLNQDPFDLARRAPQTLIQAMAAEQTWLDGQQVHPA